ncbi:HEAT repeat-containing protein [Paenibacillus catalpae]|uniref:HEAT repeat-containing protein n=1 Tax=Paenibacillus catalpae TaxID=1045775 RepID=A0A1I1XXZ6_9BACL|nr:virulence factor [Paenibacillus catalpae]SFE11638.1 HEAT repeat-containing protein [Paenibacillus catalpae]
MKLISIEPTPSPNSMKLNVDESLPRGVRQSYTKKESDSAPEPLRSLLAIEGVRSIFRTADFIALDRVSNADWARILADARALLQGGSDGDDAAGGAALAAESYGEAHVLVQMFRGIPMQVRVKNGEREARSALPPKFADAVSEAAGASMIRERMLEEFGIRYGELEEIAAEIVKELDAAYTTDRLQELIAAAQALGPGEEPAAPARPAPLSAEEISERLDSPEWQIRYAAMERMSPEPELLPLIARALHDENMSIRRLAVVYLGDLRTPEAMPYLFEALRDKSVSVRRTAGDTLSDWGDPAATGPMIEALRDPNKLVRWRAARFLYEAGDESAVEALREAAKDAEFEIQLQAQIALERIERGEEAAGSVWQQMTAARNREQQ